MKTSTLSLLTAFISAAFVSLVSAQDTKTAPGKISPPNARNKSEPVDKGKEQAPPATQAEFLKTAARKGSQ
jgi:hypothetical protein